ncbi:hypothetical protein [Nocardioides sp.]|uniref:hypothetical protein n=1 Tax=Nocardioides sp. TaxID=35761 RepID=UPI0035122EC8
MIGHLSGPRVTALLDGRLAKRESDEAWAHVYSCHPCRDLVEREGWIKSRLAGLGAHSEDDAPSASSALKGSLLNLPPSGAGSPWDAALAPSAVAPRRGERRPSGALLAGGGALGAAVLGVVALGVAPGGAPVTPRPPVTQISTGVPSSPTPPPPGRPGPGGATSVGGPTSSSAAVQPAQDLITLLRTPVRAARR